MKMRMEWLKAEEGEVAEDGEEGHGKCGGSGRGRRATKKSGGRGEIWGKQRSHCKGVWELAQNQRASQILEAEEKRRPVS
ncbi:hypothetical protein LOK49_LG09G01202 [Camellia lanceoleosa]|uniref:Uncharacterized protein n=1 Tax=Camellia lanceoleosa TaxID=1840588 RepID=A0ACC0GFG6_9ERIC|nr:hypothetical protein LOK49_LG09G01202 [Camellia lanceoleosa]